MKNKKLIYKKEDGDIVIVYQNDESLKFIIKNVIPKDAFILILDETQEIPDYYDYFSQAFDFDWSLQRLSEARIQIDIEKAKNIFLKYIRYKRDELFLKLDIEFMKVLETGNQTEIQKVTTKKQELRDITNIDFSNVNTLEDLIDKWPTNLLGETPFK